MSKIHTKSDVRSTRIAGNTRIWQFSVILEGATIGENCNICCHTFIENDVTVGNNVTLKCGVYLWDGITLEDDVFIGPNATFTNDKHPRSKKHQQEVSRTVVKRGASVGAGAIIVGPLEIGEYAMIGAGSVVTKDVPSFSLVVGNPARVVGTVNVAGEVVRRT